MKAEKTGSRRSRMLSGSCWKRVLWFQPDVFIPIYDFLIKATWQEVRENLQIPVWVEKGFVNKRNGKKKLVWKWCLETSQLKYSDAVFIILVHYFSLSWVNMNQSCVCLIDGAHINEQLNRPTTCPIPPPSSTFLFASQLKSQCMKGRQSQTLWSRGQIFVRIRRCCVPCVCILGWEWINVYSHVLRRILHKVIRNQNMINYYKPCGLSCHVNSGRLLIS